MSATTTNDACVEGIGTIAYGVYCATASAHERCIHKPMSETTTPEAKCTFPPEPKASPLPKVRGGVEGLNVRQRKLSVFASELRHALDFMPSGYKGATDDRASYAAPVEALIAALEAEADKP